ncbi:unnamed protein product [Lactuca saligna]|uniref:histone acetyltransferase n=1 Tax=Lactuca saligna TaxID=75948 RepID=A0AA35YYR6_LACSI|nr:unnamed protein product [Lactuca saligna]
MCRHLNQERQEMKKISGFEPYEVPGAEGLVVREFGSECGGPNQCCVYISYLDFVKYKSMLKKGVEDGVLMDYINLYNQFFIASGEGNTKITATHLPFFNGDYWSRAAENIVRKLEVEETSACGLQSKLPNKRILKAMG